MRRCKSYLFIKLMLFSWPFLNLDHIGMVRIPKWCLFNVETKNTIFVPFKIEWVFDSNIDIVYMTLIWYIGLCVWIDKLEHERPLNDAKGSRRRDNNKWGGFIINYIFWYHIWGQGTKLWGCMPALVTCWFSRKIMFLTNEVRYIYYWWMSLLFY